MGKNNERILTLASLLIAALSAHAQSTLSNVSLYHRCYAQLTQNFPDPNSEREQRVANGVTDPIDACIEVMDLAQFTRNSGKEIQDANNKEAKAVLKAMHHLHHSWFAIRHFSPIFNEQFNNQGRDVFEASSPALYFTKALFDSSFSPNEILLTGDILEPVRSNGRPNNGPITGFPKGQYIFNEAAFTPTGALLGVNTRNSYRWNHPDNSRIGSAPVGINYGGGVIGSQPYILMNLQEFLQLKSDGGIAMPRKWANYVYKDFLCRDLPAVRNEDAQPFLLGETSIPFRTNLQCTKCHASMDRTAASFRNVQTTRYVTSPQIQTRPYGLILANPRPTNRNSAELWPAEPDALYAFRPREGVLFFRDYEGRLINENVMGPQGLGNAIVQQDQYYACIAKKYYEYFLNTPIDLNDVEDPSYERVLTEVETSNREKVIQLGLQFRGHQDPRLLIADILRSPEYRNSNFGRKNSP